MKKTLIALAVVVGLTATGYSQGYVFFDDANTASGVVTYNAAPSATTGAANYNYSATFTVQLWYISALTAPSASSEGANSFGYLTTSQFLSDSYTLAATQSGSGGGFNAGSSVALSGVTGGNNALLALVAWTGNFANLAAAISGNANIGIITFSNPTASSSLSPSIPELTGWDALPQTAASAAYAASKTVAGAADLILSPVPEPSSLALAGLGGLASLMAIRRKKA
jgi:PEP-CTERM motif-containing protein